ncbi:MAG: glycosyltransferase family 39 protein [Patescibacteria group bacterium]|jgi:hypothetical protein
MSLVPQQKPSQSPTTPVSTNRRTTTIVIGVMLILGSMLGLEIYSSLQESQTIDEAVHLAAGFSYWKTGDFRINPEHPPLGKLLTAFPLLFTDARIPTEHPSWNEVNQWKFGEIFLYENTLSPDTLLLLGRLPVMLLSIGLGILIFMASRSIFGTAGGFLSLGLYAFDPNIIAHSRYITTDLSFSVAAFFVLLRFVSLIKTPSRKNAIWFSIALLIACLTKFSFLAFAVALVIAALVLKIRDRRHPALQLKKIGKALLIGIPISLLLVWALYGFDIRRPADDPRIAQLYVQRENAIANNLFNKDSALERFVIYDLGDRSKGIGKKADELARHAYPMYTFFRGAINVIGHSMSGQTSFLMGDVRDRGWWWYFPAAFGFKTPIPTLIAFGMTTILLVSWIIQRRPIDRRWIIFGLPPLLFFLLSFTSHLNLGWRHIMPIYPPLFVLAGSITTLRIRRARLTSYFIVTLFVGISAFTAFHIFPNYLGYFNEFAGDRGTNYKILRDSNLDWGQDLPKLRTYVNENNIAPLYVAYYGAARVESYIPGSLPLPTTDEIQTAGIPSGYIAISGERLYSLDDSYTWLQTKTPIDRLGSTLFIYRLTP